MQPYKNFIQKQLGYYLVIAISLTGLVVYLEYIPYIRIKKEETIVYTVDNLKNDSIKLALALGVQHTVVEGVDNNNVAGVSDENIKPQSDDSSFKLYIVKEGDSLWKIAQYYYNDGFKAFEIAKENNLVNIDIIQPGISLKLPNP